MVTRHVPPNDARPDPDPTRLTTEQLMREVGALREVMEALITGNNTTLSARLDGMDKAINLLEHYDNRTPSEIDSKVDNLRQLHNEKFNAIQMQFSDAKLAVDAALAAVKETALGVSKSSDAIVVSAGEMKTYRDGLEQRLARQFGDMGVRVELARTEAKEANDTLERFIISRSEALTSLTDNRFNTSQNETKELEALLRELVNGANAQSVARYSSLKELLETQTEMSATAISKAESANERRFDATSDFTKQISAQQAQLVTRAELKAQFDPVTENMHKLEQRIGANEGRNRGSAAAVSYVVVAITLLIGLISLIVTFVHRGS